jgi:hypothetical protein
MTIEIVDFPIKNGGSFLVVPSCTQPISPRLLLLARFKGLQRPRLRGSEARVLLQQTALPRCHPRTYGTEMEAEIS